MWRSMGLVGSKQWGRGMEVEGPGPGGPSMSPKLRNFRFGPKPSHMAGAPGSPSSPPSLPKPGQSIDTGQTPFCLEASSV